MTHDPFARIGLPATASADEVRAARNRLAKVQHPDVGGDGEAMQELNEAVVDALRLISRRDAAAPAGPATEPDPVEPDSTDPEWTGPRIDIPSFTVEALPAETFQALLAAAQQLGSVLDDDPPYRLDVELSPGVVAAGDPMVGTILCRLDVVPDAGASTVNLLIAGEVGLVPIERVRDLWIAALNDLDWGSVVG